MICHSTNNTLNITFKIKAGEKIALVGMNGAGKTTLTLLMCGMLLPDEGEILLDGHSLY
ncbi:MAG: ATP-binding cassette domain-containing protein, partial [Alphaproteobacteria bacterium]|nr:ATP-binding cassette domain-containing protein [Alphaproteobacteria bacterium]